MFSHRLLFSSSFSLTRALYRRTMFLQQFFFLALFLFLSFYCVLTSDNLAGIYNTYTYATSDADYSLLFYRSFCFLFIQPVRHVCECVFIPFTYWFWCPKKQLWVAGKHTTSHTQKPRAVAIYTKLDANKLIFINWAIDDDTTSIN